MSSFITKNMQIILDMLYLLINVTGEKWKQAICFSIVKLPARKEKKGRENFSHLRRKAGS